MLRVSAGETGREVDLNLINGEISGESSIDFAAELALFAEAVAGFDEASLVRARQALLEVAGAAVLVDAAGVAANFQRMVRIADSTGIPVDVIDNQMMNEVRVELDLYRFRSSENSERLV